MPDFPVLHERMETVMAVSSRYTTWPMTRINDWADKVHIGDRVRYSNYEIEEINILCTITKKLPHLVVVEPVRKGYISRTRTMSYTEVCAARV
jgi:hypothetical protein